MARFGWDTFDTRTTWEHSSGNYVERNHATAGYAVWMWDEDEGPTGTYTKRSTHKTLTQAQKALEIAVEQGA